MEIYRKTKLLVDLDAITSNVKKIIASYPDYKYYFGVVKANCYGLGFAKVVQAIIDGGCNYLCVSLVEEALALRESFAGIPILVLNPAPQNALGMLNDKNIAVTVANPEHAKDAASVSGLRVFIRANGGHDLFGGPTNRQDFEAFYGQIINSGAILEGVYLHNYHAENEEFTQKEYAIFEGITAGIDLSTVPVVSTSFSLTLPRYAKKPYCNACRIGNVIYGIENDTMDLKNCFALTSEIVQIVRLGRGDSIGYGNAYTAQSNEELIGVIPIGYGDGFAKSNAGRDVYIENRRYKIVAVTMDITLLLIDQDVKKGDAVFIIRDARHLDEIAAHNHSVAEEAVCLLNDRIPKIYK